MNNLITQIPFCLNDKKGIVEVCYEKNNSVHKSGFDLLSGLNFNAEMCIGYPTMRASIKSYEGTGYYTACAWIQIITDRFFSLVKDTSPKEIVSEVDVSNNMRKREVPFFSYGYPAEIYDAPCNNLGKYARLEWIADTFLVTLPSRMNNDIISYLVGFRWGYEESEIETNRHVKILPLEVTDSTVWNGHLAMLRDNFPNWNFE